MDIYCYSYVEDAPSAEVAKRLVTYRNSKTTHRLCFREGFPLVTGGYGSIKEKCAAFLAMASSGIHTVCITDLDTIACPCKLIRDWFGIAPEQVPRLPKEVQFRVAVREVESWIMADVRTWASFIGIDAGNWTPAPDLLPNPKQYLLNVIRRRGTKKIHKEMLPRGIASIGPRYNTVLCDFVSRKWSPYRASLNSPSLKRAIDSLLRV